MSGKNQVMQMLFDLAEPALRALPKATGSDENHLRTLWQKGWGRALAESDGDLVQLADAACEELKMIILVALMEAEHHDGVSTSKSAAVGQACLHQGE